MTDLTTPGGFPHIVCWNPAARPEVFNTDALKTDLAVFLATHSPAFLRAEGGAAGARVRIDEVEFLDGFLTHRDSRDLHLVVGDSGTGKSHLIRWMARQAERRKAQQRADWVIRLVPRASANLADVIRHVLGDLPGESVARVRERVATAARNVSAAEARKRVLDELAHVFNRDEVTLPDGLEQLPDLLTDVSVRRWMVGQESGPLARLAAHYFGSRDRREDADPTRLQWRPEDLLLPLKLAKQSAEAVRELATNLPEDERDRQTAADLLRQASERLGGLIGLRGGDLAGALREVRTELGRRGSDLLLFLEDLSVLQGVDRDLVEALVESGPGLCRLRSVVGLTNEDFAKLPSNIRPGRVRQTVWCNVPVDEEETAGEGVTPRHMQEFAARYLNAARYSLPQLGKWASDPDADAQPLPSFCLASRCPNLADCHAGFGAVEIGGQEYGLYPLSPELITRLYRQATRPERGARTGGLTAFNPRRLVGVVLNKVLAEAERAIPEKEFPARRLAIDFDLHEAAVVDVAVASRLKARYPRQGERLVNALELYSPNLDVADPRLAPGVAEAFDLPRETADPFDAWAADRPLPEELLPRLVPQLHKALVDRLHGVPAGRFPPSAIRIEPMASTADTLVHVRRSDDAARVLRGLHDSERRDEGWKVVAERMLGLWAGEVERRVTGGTDEFDRWLRNDTLPESTAEKLRAEVRSELSSQLTDTQGQKFQRVLVTFDGERVPPGGRAGLLLRRAEPVAETLRYLWGRLQGRTVVRPELVNAQLRAWVAELRPLLGEGTDPFTVWANGGPVDDLNAWRVLVHDAVVAVIDWDTEPGLAPLRKEFQQRYIHFQAPFGPSRRPPGAVGLDIEQSIESGLALRTLYRHKTGDQVVDPVEAEDGLIATLAWVRRHADEVRRQLHVLAPSRTGPDTVRLAGRILAIRAVCSGRIRADTPIEELLTQTLATFDADESEPEARSAPWRQLWAAFRDHGPDARAVLLDALTATKGSELTTRSARMLDPSPILDELRAVAKDPLAVASQPLAAPQDGPLVKLASAVREHLPRALDAERSDVRAWAREVRTFLGKKTPEELAGILAATFREAAKYLRGDDAALELETRTSQLPHREIGLLLADAEGAASLADVARLDRGLMAGYLDYLQVADRVVDATLAQLGEPVGGAQNLAALRDEVGRHLSDLHAALDALTR